MSRERFVGVDGGGSRIRTAVADGGGRVLARGERAAEAADPALAGTRAGEVAAAVREALAAAGSRAPAAALVAGLAGAGDPAVRSHLAGALRSCGVARRVEVVGDGEIALEGAFPGREVGIVLVAGTGSVAYARDPAGRVLRCGGWGTVAGDEGSGHELGRAALRALFRAEDGRGPDTVLGGRILARLGLEEVRALPGWAAGASKREVASLAVEVVAAAGAGDAVATVLLGDAVAALGELVGALGRRLGAEGSLPLVLRGGLATSPPVADRLVRALAEGGRPVRVVPGAGDALAGALRMAASGPPSRSS